MKHLVVSFLILSISPLASAHEGHDHGPAIAQAPHGGTFQKGKKIAIEIVQEGGELKIYPLTTALKALKSSDINITATYELPKKKAEGLSLQSSDDFFVAKVDAKGAHRFKLDLNISYQGSKENLSFQIEPEKD